MNFPDIFTFVIPVLKGAKAAKLAKAGEEVAVLAEKQAAKETIEELTEAEAKIIAQTAKEAIENGTATKATKEAVEKVENEIIEKTPTQLEEVVVQGKKKTPNLSDSELDWMASRKVGNLGGEILKVSQIRKLRGILKQKGIHLIVEGDSRNVTKLFQPVDDFKTIDDLFRAMSYEGFPGGFNAHTKQFYLSKNATEIVAFHEMAHLKHFEEIGGSYLKLSKLKKETYVWEQIIANRTKWTKAELQDALNYINDIRTNPRYGYNLEPLKIKI